MKLFSGVVISKKTDKTVVVKLPKITKHPLYKKVLRRYVKYLVHDEDNCYKQGDRVLIKSCRPYSKRKCWIAVEAVSVGGKDDTNAE